MHLFEQVRNMPRQKCQNVGICLIIGDEVCVSSLLTCNGHLLIRTGPSGHSNASILVTTFTNTIGELYESTSIDNTSSADDRCSYKSFLLAPMHYRRKVCLGQFNNGRSTRHHIYPRFES